MTSKGKLLAQDRHLRSLSHSIGNFILYWGFRRVHGAIWTQLYLSKNPLSCTELTHRLGLSKALISPALDELCSYKLIREAQSPNQKVRVYQAVENISEVVQHVLRTRETKMLKQITKDFSSFQEKRVDSDHLNPDRVNSLGEMILSANLMLEMILTQESLLGLPQELKK